MAAGTLAGDVKLGPLGKVPKKGVAIVGGGALVLAAGGYLYRARLDAGDGETVYGEGYDEFGNLEGADPYYTPGPGGLFEPGDEEDQGFGSNSEWAQAAVDYLVTSGIEREAAGVAIGKFLRSDKLTADEYRWVVLALGVMGPPPMGSFTPLPGGGPGANVPLPAPTGITHTGGKGTITFRWSPVTGASGYDAELIAGESSRVKGPQVVGGTSVVFSGLRPDPGVPYRLNVWARTPAGTRGARGTAVGRTGTAQGPAPTTLRAPGGIRSAPSRTGVTIRWTPVTGARGYAVSLIQGLRSTVPGSVRLVTGPVYTHQGLTPGKPYRARIAAVSGPNRYGPASNHRFRTDR